jgi:hypothetical protein
LDDTVSATDLAATVTLADADYVNLAAILHNDGALQGLRLPNVGATPTDLTAADEGFLAYDEAGNNVLVNTGAAWVAISNPFGAAIDSSEITDGTITTDDVAVDTLLAVDIATGGVATAELLDGTILTGDVATDTLLAGNIATDAVGASHLC